MTLKKSGEGDHNTHMVQLHLYSVVTVIVRLYCVQVGGPVEGCTLCAMSSGNTTE